MPSNQAGNIFIAHSQNTRKVRTESFMGREYRVVPAVLVRNQVLRNNIGRTLLPASAFTDEWAHLWNNVPVLVGDHPTQRGIAVSGRNPEILDKRGVGFIFNARIDRSGSKPRLVGEVWLDASRADAVPDLANILNAVNEGKPVELSTGFPVEQEEVAGNFGVDRYDVILHPAGADHLVIASDMTGACSVRDGCGLGVNKAAENFNENHDPSNGEFTGGSGGGSSSGGSGRGGSSSGPKFAEGDKVKIGIGEHAGKKGVVSQVSPRGTHYGVAHPKTGAHLGYYSESDLHARNFNDNHDPANGEFTGGSGGGGPSGPSSPRAASAARRGYRNLASTAASASSVAAKAQARANMGVRGGKPQRFRDRAAYDAHKAATAAHIRAGEKARYAGMPSEAAMHEAKAAEHFQHMQTMAGRAHNKAQDGKMPPNRSFVEQDAPQASGLKRFVDRALNMLELGRETRRNSWEENAAANIARYADSLNQVDMSDQDRQSALRDALQEEFGGSDRNVSVCDVYSNDGYVVFWLSTPFGPEPRGSEYFKVEYSEGPAGEYTFAGTPIRVVRMTVYEPIGDGSQEQAANAARTSPCGCQEATTMDANERKGLLDEVTTAVNAALKPVTDAVSKFEEVAENAATNAAAAIKGELETSLNALKGEVAQITGALNADRDAERQAIITTLSANARTKDVYSAADLESMNLEQLRKTAQLARVEVASYAGRGGPQATNAAVEEPSFIEPTPYFAKKEEAK